MFDDHLAEGKEPSMREQRLRAQLEDVTHRKALVQKRMADNQLELAQLIHEEQFIVAEACELHVAKTMDLIFGPPIKKGTH